MELYLLIKRHLDLKYQEMRTNGWWNTFLPAFSFVLLICSLIHSLISYDWYGEDWGYAPFIFILGLVMAISVYIFDTAPVLLRPLKLGLWLILVSLFFCLIGSALGNIFTVYIALIGVLSGAVLYLYGWWVFKKYAYAWLALFFAAPLPGAIVAAITFPIKMNVSMGAVALLQVFDFPVSRNGVIIDIGDYRLLVADACSGLQSMFSLFAVAVLYLFLMRNHTRLQTLILMLSTLPIVFFLNVLRVVVLAIITFIWGDMVGQGFLHKFAGVLMFLAAFWSLMGIDKLLSFKWSHSN